MTISISQLNLSIIMRKTASSKAPVKSELLVEYLNSAMATQAINTPNRVAAFLANLAVESSELTLFEENLNYSAQGLMNTFNSKRIIRFPTLEFATGFARQPQKIANYVYANRNGNGNEQSGDGWRYRGRGPIQLTGRSNYRDIGNDLSLDLEANPDQALAISTGILIAARFFNKKGCNHFADTVNDASFTRVCELINGGHKGLEERFQYWKKALQILGGK